MNGVCVCLSIIALKVNDTFIGLVLENNRLLFDLVLDYYSISRVYVGISLNLLHSSGNYYFHFLFD